MRQIWCAQHHIAQYSQYGRNDETLAAFLQSCQPTVCATCSDATPAHVRNFFHGGHRLSVSVFSLGKRDRDTPPPTGNIWAWVRVKNRPDISRKAARKVKLSTSARCLSFAHFLELFISMVSVTIGGATLNRNVALFFKLGHCIVCLNPNLNRPFSVVIPAEPLEADGNAYGLTIQREAVALLLVRPPLPRRAASLCPKLRGCALPRLGCGRLPCEAVARACAGDEQRLRRARGTPRARQAARCRGTREQADQGGQPVIADARAYQVHEQPGDDGTACAGRHKRRSRGRRRALTDSGASRRVRSEDGR